MWFTHPACLGESLSVIVVKPFGGDRVKSSSYWCGRSV